MPTLASLFDAPRSACARWQGVATIALQLNSLAMGANQAIQLFGDRRAPKLARGAMRAALGGAIPPPQ